MKPIVTLEDNHERLVAFERTVVSLGDKFEAKVRHDAPSTIAARLAAKR